jgi:exodeoxyribonuclease VII large subunit
MRLSEAESGLDRAIQRREEQAMNRLQTLSGRLAALNPLAVLSRGYAAVGFEKGTVTRAEQVHAGDMLKIRFADGVVSAEAKAIEGAKENAEEKSEL